MYGGIKSKPDVRSNQGTQCQDVLMQVGDGPFGTRPMHQ